MGAGYDRAPAPQARSGSHYSVALFLCGGNGTAHPGIARGCDGFNPRRQLLLRTTSISAKQPRGSGVFHSLLEHERTVFHRVPAFIRGGWRNCAVRRPVLQTFPAACGSGSFSAAKPPARSTSMDALRLRMALRWGSCVACSVDWFVAVNSLVFPPAHTDFFAGKPRRCSDRILCPRRCPSVANHYAASPVGRSCFQ